MSPVTLTFASVEQPGNTTISSSNTGPAAPVGFQVGNPAIYYDLHTTAVFSGQIHVCINYGGTTFDSGALQLLHYENGAWVDVTDSLDTAHTLICGMVTSLSPFAVFRFTYTGTIQPPIATNGSSVFKASRGVVPIKFTLALNGVVTCQLPPATISLFRTSGSTPVAINQSVFTMPSDVGANFRIDTANCQYVYNLGSSALDPGIYSVRISIYGLVAGTGTFALK